MSDVNSPSFWEESYRSGRAPWDLGGPTPVFRRLFDSGQFEPARLIVLGAGRGHDAHMLARRGFEVTAVDFAAGAARDIRAQADPEAPVEVLEADIFDLPSDLDQTFDYVVEYTCFCAIDPARREAYADLVDRLLKPGGILIALLFPIWEHSGGPPFAVSPTEFDALFKSRGFRLVQHEVPDDSVKPRRGIEVLAIYQKGETGL